jgi:hypothetical protein
MSEILQIYLRGELVAAVEYILFRTSFTFRISLSCFCSEIGSILPIDEVVVCKEGRDCNGPSANITDAAQMLGFHIRLCLVF